MHKAYKQSMMKDEAIRQLLGFASGGPTAKKTAPEETRSEAEVVSDMDRIRRNIRRKVKKNGS